MLSGTASSVALRALAGRLDVISSSGIAFSGCWIWTSAARGSQWWTFRDPGTREHRIAPINQSAGSPDAFHSTPNTSHYYDY